MSSLTAVAATLGVACLGILWLGLSSKKTPYPPGPPPSFIVGNLSQMPKEHEWLTFAKMSKQYGPLLHLRVLAQHIAVIDTLKVANELLVKRSSIYSSRPRLVMAGEMIRFAEALALMPYSTRFNQIRRLLHKELTGAELVKYWRLHEEESYALIKAIVADPAQILNSIRHYAGSVILKVSYGYQVKPKDDPFLLLAEKVMGVFAIASQPGAWLVDLMPWMRHIPSWVPGAKFKSLAEQWEKLHMEVVVGPYEWAKKNQNSPSLIKPNFTSTVFEATPNLTKEEEEVLFWSSASLWGGGADTTVSAISSFFLAMGLYPKIQLRAQTELNAVLGDHKLPTLNDRTSLPYIDCIMLEVLRWNPVGPLGVPHLLTKDDVFEGYYLPKGTIIIANIWSMLHDPEVFPDPHIFNPDRFIDNPTAREVVKAAFGFGRRACPGMNFAESSMFMAFATALALCEVSDPKDVDGNPVPSDILYKTGTISHPQPFTCTVKYRSKSHAELLDTY